VSTPEASGSCAPFRATPTPLRTCAGFREHDIDINVTGNRLTVSGKRNAEQVDDSVLPVHVPKTAEAQPKRIQLRGGNGGEKKASA
jgi:hypothetical protein